MRALAALLLLGWLALQAPIGALLDHYQHPTTTPKEGNR
jgi:hypothetical protein